MLYKIKTVEGEALVDVTPGKGKGGSHITVIDGECEAKHMIAAHQCWFDRKAKFKGKDFEVTLVESHPTLQ